MMADLKNADLLHQRSQPKEKPHADKPYSLTDSGFAELIHYVNGDNWFFLFNENEWYYWTGKHWDLDKTGRFINLLKITAQEKLIDVLSMGLKDQARFYMRCCDSPGLANVGKAARDLFAISPDLKDALTNLFPFNNGVYNLDTHIFTPEHVRSQYLTKIARVDYQPAAQCPLWDAHLRLVFEDDKEIIDFFQEVAGYTLLHDNPAQIFVLLYGDGKNGKSVTREVLALILDKYAKSAPVETIMKRRSPGDAGGARGDLIHISTARMVQISEGNPEHELAAGLIKQITGGDPLYARNPYAKYGIEHRPGYKIWFVTNHLPIIDGADYALMRRIFLIPFHAIIPEEMRVDQYAEVLFNREGPGILNWMIEGLKRYQSRGRFELPQKVLAAIQKYRTDSDILIEWMEDECVKEAGAEEQRAILYSAYTTWCEGAGADPVKQHQFWKALKNKGIDTENVWVLRKRGCRGVRLKTKQEMEIFYAKFQKK
jgi:putative DNA primase/helicase